jgi:hypothetical protein
MRQGADLLQEFHHRHLDPVFADLAVLYAVNMNLGPMDALIGWALSHERSSMGRDGRASFHYFVAPRDEILFSYDDVRESSVHHSPHLLEPLKTGRQRTTEVVREMAVKKVTDSIHVVLVFEDSREFPYDALILFLLHVVLSGRNHFFTVRVAAAGGWLRLSAR